MKKYDWETHEKLLKIISGRDKRKMRIKVISNAGMALLMLSFPFFLFEKANIFMTSYKIFVAEIFSLLTVLYMNSAIFPENDELISRKEISDIRKTTANISLNFFRQNLTLGREVRDNDKSSIYKGEA